MNISAARSVLFLFFACAKLLILSGVASVWKQEVGKGWTWHLDSGDGDAWVWIVPDRQWEYRPDASRSDGWAYSSGKRRWLWNLEGLNGENWYWDSISGWFAKSEGQIRPNVVLIMTDDQGYGDLGLHGNTVLETPVLDELGQSGLRGTRFYVHPVCAPTRASLLSSRYHLEVGVSGVSRRREVMYPEVVTLGQLFQAGGYRTGCFGKWHNGAYYPENPQGQGFDEFYGFPEGLLMNYFSPLLERNGVRIREEGYITDLITDAAIDFIQASHELNVPFFCYIPYNAPHWPALVPAEFFLKYKAKGLDDTLAAVYGMIDSVDQNVGRILSLLDDLGIEEDTIVIFLTDNGPNTARYNAGLRGFKGSFSDGGTRVPFLMRWPRVISAPGTIDRMLAHIDILPTLADICELPGLELLPLEGRSFSPLLQDPEAPWADRLIYGFNWGPNIESSVLVKGSVRSQQWLALLVNSQWSLFDIVDDPSEGRNLATARASILDGMRDAYLAKLDEMGEFGRIAPIPVGYPEWPTARIGGHDAILNGSGIRFNVSTGYPNHWITGWTGKDSYPEWDLDVATPSTFTVSILYALREEDAGVELELQAGDQRISFRIDEFHDPPTESLDFYRSGDEEFYASKEWGSVKVGDVNLDMGRQSIVLRTLSMPGNASVEIKEVTLDRIE